MNPSYEVHRSYKFLMPDNDYWGMGIEGGSNTKQCKARVEFIHETARENTKNRFMVKAA